MYFDESKLSNISGWRSFIEVKKWVNQMHVKSETEWRKIKKSNLLPIDIPCNPNTVYIEWKSWSDFLGTQNIYIKPKQWRKFSSSRYWSRNSGINSAREWGKKYDANLIPKNIPRTPDKVYFSEWISWMDWLGVDCQKGHRKAWMNIEDAKEWVEKNRIKNERTWRFYCKENLIPENIPKSPNVTYKNTWKGWKDFFNK